MEVMGKTERGLTAKTVRDNERREELRRRNLEGENGESSLCLFLRVNPL